MPRRLEFHKKSKISCENVVTTRNFSVTNQINSPFAETIELAAREARMLPISLSNWNDLFLCSQHDNSPHQAFGSFYNS